MVFSSYHLSPPAKGQDRTITCNIEEVTMAEAFYDTGAACTTLSECIFRKIQMDKRPSKLLHAHDIITSVNNNPLRIRGYYRFKVQLLNRTVTVDIYVSPDINSHMIIGTDFIQSRRLS